MSFLERRRLWTAGSKRASAVALIVVVIATIAVPALATHPVATLPGSNFEIDVDANLKVDHPPAIDWASVNEIRATDTPSGTNDNSYSGGTKEDTVCPTTTTGSIPNNKSDLLNFGVYREPHSTIQNHPGFLNLFWTRVLEPNGTTLMDFELNQSSTACAAGAINPVRTGDGNGPLTDDILIEYSIDQGGARADITIRKWTGTAWGPADELSATEAAGTINSSEIPVADADGLAGPISPRTFGEASIDLTTIFPPNTCVNLASAFLKSRASDSFTSQVKDFIAPQPINLTNCASVIIHKETDPDSPTTPLFNFSKTFDVQTPPADSDTFQLADDGTKTFTNVFFGTGLTVQETLASLPAGWEFVNVDCTASVGVTPSINQTTSVVTFDLDAPTDILECTFNNRSLGALEITKTRKHADSATGITPHAGVSFTVTGPGGFSQTVVTGSDGKVCIGNLVPGSYTVTESVPANYSGEDPKTVNVAGGGTCASNPTGVSFVNTPLTDVTITINSQEPGGTDTTVTCNSGDAQDPLDTPDATGDGTLVLENREPEILTCVINIDP